MFSYRIVFGRFNRLYFFLYVVRQLSFFHFLSIFLSCLPPLFTVSTSQPLVFIVRGGNLIAHVSSCPAKSHLSEGGHCKVKKKGINATPAIWQHSVRNQRRSLFSLFSLATHATEGFYYYNLILYLLFPWELNWVKPFPLFFSLSFAHPLYCTEPFSHIGSDPF